MSTTSTEASTSSAAAERDGHHAAVREDGRVGPLTRHPRAAERHDVLAVRHLAARGAVEHLGLEHDDGSGSRTAAASRPFASAGVEGIATFTPGVCT